MDISPTGEVIIRHKKINLTVHVILGFGMTVLFVWMFLLPEGASRRPSWLLHIVGFVGTAPFGLGTLYDIRRLFDGPPALVLDQLGIIDNTYYLGVGRISWSEIRGVRIAVLGRRFLTIDVRSPKEFINRGNVFQQLLRGLNNRMMGTPIVIRATTLGMTVDELTETVKGYMARR
ncbi:MAG TPA: STM3941 family protein [Reyranella sp.]